MTGTVLETEQLCRLEVDMPRKKHVFLVDQHRDGEAKGANIIGDLADLFLRMSVRVTRVGS